MKRRFLLISLFLALVLTVLTPVAALAAKPVHFSTSGNIAYISPSYLSEILPAGKSGRWVVHERELGGSISGDISGDFVLTYRANVDENQAGSLAGTLTVGDGSFIIKVSGKSQPLEMVYFEAFQTYLPKMSINGHWTFIEGAQGTGSFEAWFVFIPEIDEHGNVHVGQIVDSALELTGKWQP